MSDGSRSGSGAGSGARSRAARRRRRPKPSGTGGADALEAIDTTGALEPWQAPPRWQAPEPWRPPPPGVSGTDLLRGAHGSGSGPGSGSGAPGSSGSGSPSRFDRRSGADRGASASASAAAVSASAPGGAAHFKHRSSARPGSGRSDVVGSAAAARDRWSDRFDASVSDLRDVSGATAERDRWPRRPASAVSSASPASSASDRWEVAGSVGARDRWSGRSDRPDRSDGAWSDDRRSTASGSPAAGPAGVTGSTHRGDRRSGSAFGRNPWRDDVGTPGHDRPGVPMTSAPADVDTWELDEIDAPAPRRPDAGGRSARPGSPRSGRGRLPKWASPGSGVSRPSRSTGGPTARPGRSRRGRRS